jgi:hypothetical protein
MRTIDDHPALCIHPELSVPRHARGAFEVEGLPGGLRRWFVYDSNGVVRIEKAMHSRDIDRGFKARLETELDALEERDRRHEA